VPELKIASDELLETYNEQYRDYSEAWRMINQILDEHWEAVKDLQEEEA